MQLPHNALRTLDPRPDRFNRVRVIFYRKTLIQNLELRLNLHAGALVVREHPPHRLHLRVRKVQERIKADSAGGEQISYLLRHRH